MLIVSDEEILKIHMHNKQLTRAKAGCKMSDRELPRLCVPGIDVKMPTIKILSSKVKNTLQRQSLSYLDIIA